MSMIMKGEMMIFDYWTYIKETAIQKALLDQT